MPLVQFGAITKLKERPLTAQAWFVILLRVHSLVKNCARRRTAPG
jgi:hypothetical protein